MKDILITCRCCRGTGRESLNGVLRETLAVVPRERFISTDEVIRKLQHDFVGRSAIINRLSQQLLPLGLVENERRGKTLFWRRKA